jgi:hypothetical protein
MNTHANTGGPHDRAASPPFRPCRHFSNTGVLDDLFKVAPPPPGPAPEKRQQEPNRGVWGTSS